MVEDLEPLEPLGEAAGDDGGGEGWERGGQGGVRCSIARGGGNGRAWQYTQWKNGQGAGSPVCVDA